MRVNDEKKVVVELPCMPRIPILYYFILTLISFSSTSSGGTSRQVRYADSGPRPPQNVGTLRNHSPRAVFCRTSEPSCRKYQDLKLYIKPFRCTLPPAPPPPLSTPDPVGLVLCVNKFSQWAIPNCLRFVTMWDKYSCASVITANAATLPYGLDDLAYCNTGKASWAFLVQFGGDWGLGGWVRAALLPPKRWSSIICPLHFIDLVGTGLNCDYLLRGMIVCVSCY
ncbi:hypothetical protein VOLCADRAFT_91921 [Volvox carteri f. nagariensis]|uniref:Uncharacterized protein n=1 Tax=Volvox carteri f. nagariensis TaxID=3068 RepID=D8TYB0_VOLCA|nr:uncharacterized protein VOLCADRAFT_91921 [Volvox carteri f. nagariensis]EFJ47520.1 hypothetical protein VOLCADRAFT_91921 [Volvox carteri f. nagariensis]|eukprot:XP_002951344.1 hypothetical protein VOLCADRAFT_91921 [Volvox carteri f. nagariensis]